MSGVNENHSLDDDIKSVESPRVLPADGRKPIDSVLYACRHSFYIAFMVTAIVDLLGIVPILFMMNVYDRAISTKSGITLASLTLLVISVYIFWSALEWIRSRLMVRLSLRIDWDLSADIFDASFRRFVGRRNVDVHQLLGDLTTLRQFLTGQGILTVMDAPFAIVFILIGGLFHPYLAAFAFIASLLMLLTTYFTKKITSPILQVANDANSGAARMAAESLRHAEATLALGMMGAIRQRWYGYHRVYLQNQVNASEASGLMGGVSGFLSKAMPSLQMALGAFLAMEGLITGGMVMACSMLISKAVGPFQKLLANWKDIIQAKQSYDRLNALLAEDIKRDSHMKLPDAVGRLEVTDAFALPPGHMKLVLSQIKFTIEPGEAVAIVGPSAAGKTCLVRMLIGIWKPVKGSVRLDGVEISDWNHDEIGPQMGYVPQEIEFFQGTVAENIARLGEVDPVKVVEAAQLIGMHETILAFPKGYDTEIGPTGFALSGGQRQRLAIARAFYNNPKYIVMDEPNANLDEVGESVLALAVSKLKELGSTIVITTHRPRLVSVVDKLLVLRSGQQVGFGPAEDMINAVRNLQTGTAVIDKAENNEDGAEGDQQNTSTETPVIATNQASVPSQSNVSPVNAMGHAEDLSDLSLNAVILAASGEFPNRPPSSFDPNLEDLSGAEAEIAEMADSSEPVEPVKVELAQQEEGHTTSVAEMGESGEVISDQALVTLSRSLLEEVTNKPVLPSGELVDKNELAAKSSVENLEERILVVETIQHNDEDDLLGIHPDENHKSMIDASVVSTVPPCFIR